MLKCLLPALFMACMLGAPQVWANYNEMYLRATNADDILRTRDALLNQTHVRVIKPPQLLGFRVDEQFSEEDVVKALGKLRKRIEQTGPLCDRPTWNHLNLPSQQRLQEVVAFIDGTLEPMLLKQARDMKQAEKEASFQRALAVFNQKAGGLSFWGYLKRSSPETLANPAFQEALPHVLRARLQTMIPDHRKFLKQKPTAQASILEPKERLKSWDEVFSLVESVTDKRNRQLGILLLAMGQDLLVYEKLIPRDEPVEKWHALLKIMTRYGDLPPQKVSGTAFKQIIEKLNKESSDEDAELIQNAFNQLSEASPKWMQLLKDEAACTRLMAAD